MRMAWSHRRAVHRVQHCLLAMMRSLVEGGPRQVGPAPGCPALCKIYHMPNTDECPGW